MVVGLGNPGAKYARNRHNVGFRAVELVASRHGLGELKSGGKLGAASATGVIVTPRGRQKVVLLQPMEFMNLSGFAVQRAAKFYGVELDHTLVVHDEIDRDHRLDQFGTVALFNGNVAHRREIDEQWHAGEILQHHAGDDEGDFCRARCLGLPVGEFAHMVFGHLAAVAMAQHRLEHDADRHRQARDAANAGGFERG